MIYIFKQKNKDNAKVVQDFIEKNVSLCEHNKEKQQRKEGMVTLVFEKETMDSAIKRLKAINDERHLPFDASTVQDISRINYKIGESVEADEFIFSSNAIKVDGTPITINDFPGGFCFGNGVTVNANIALKDGSKHILCWCVFPKGTQLTKHQKSLLDSL